MNIDLTKTQQYLELLKTNYTYTLLLCLLKIVLYIDDKYTVAT